MPYLTTSKPRRLTDFRSADQAVDHACAEGEWGNVGGHMHAKSGHIVQTRDAVQLYKVVFDHEDRPETEQACATIREGLAIIRRNTPTPPARNSSRD